MSVRRICSRAVAIVSPNETVSEAAKRMTRLSVGTLVVIDPMADDRAIGLVTDRDLVTRCLGAGADPAEARISECMSSPPHEIADDASVEEALQRMASEGVRRLVVVDAEESLLGVVSLDDVVGHLALEGDEVRRLLRRAYRHGASGKRPARERRPRRAEAPARRVTARTEGT